MKKYTVFAGVNGAGKTSLYNSALANSESLGERVNLDEIVRKSGDWRDERLQLDAGKHAVRLVRKYLKDGTSFHQETTLAGRSILHTIREAKSLGFEIVLYYVGVNTLQIAKDRVHARIQKGGHGVDDALVERRFAVSLQHLKLVIPLCDAVHIYDNSGERFRYVMILEHGVIVNRDAEIPLWLEDVFKGLVGSANE